MIFIIHLAATERWTSLILDPFRRRLPRAFHDGGHAADGAGQLRRGHRGRRVRGRLPRGQGRGRRRLMREEDAAAARDGPLKNLTQKDQEVSLQGRSQ